MMGVAFLKVQGSLLGGAGKREPNHGLQLTVLGRAPECLSADHGTRHVRGI